jgi:phenylacetate-CoA ligase
MKKIVYIGNNLSKDDKYAPTLVTLSKYLRLEEFQVQIASNKTNRYLRVFDMFWTVLRNFRTAEVVLIDTYGAFNFYYAVFVSQLCRVVGLPYIPILHGGNLPDRLKENMRMCKWVFQHSFKNIAPSNYLKSNFENAGFPTEVIPNIVEISNYAFKKRIHYSPKLLYVRAFHEIYNPTMAIRVLERVQKKYPEAVLCMIGPPKDSSFKQTKLLAKELGVENSVTYTGVLSKKEWHTMAEAYDVFINTTNVDNTPVSVMEAMAMGLPVVSTNVGGIPYLLKDGVDAFLVDANDDIAMSQKIISIVEGKENIDEIVLKARNKVEQFDWNEVRYLWFALFKSAPIKMDLIKGIYFKLPVTMQDMLISIYGIYWKNRRFGGQFKKYLPAFKERESFSKEAWKEYQTQELRKLLTHAFTTVPFYREKYKKVGFKLQDFDTFELEDLHKLPYLEKEELRKFGKTTLLSSKRKRGTFIESSGSTGTPVSIYLSRKSHQKWNAAYEIRVRNWAGVHRKMARGMIGGRRILDGRSLKPPYYRYNSIEKQAYFSAYAISDVTAADYVQGIRRKKIEYMVGYAMSNYLLAESIQKMKIQVPKLKAVLTSSELLTDEMRKKIEAVYNCKVYDAYSGVEACGLISENKHGELLFSPDTGIMEVLDQAGFEAVPGESGEVIATGFFNEDQPLIRYRIGDRVTMAVHQESKSGMQMPIISSIEGRVEDVIIGNDGRKMVRFHVVFIGIPKLILGQIVQYSREHIAVNLVVEPMFDGKNYEPIMEDRLKSQLGTILVDFHYLQKIPKNANGKYQAVISYLKKEAVEV